MDRIGMKKFSGISSDSTGNTKLAREIVAKAVPWIISLPDVCHLLNNTAKDIGKIPFFADTITRLRSIIKYFRKSSYAKRHLTALRIYLDIKKGLVSVGNTRFLTLYYSGSSLRRCLTPIKELIESKVLKLTSKVGIYWMRKRDDISNFENGLRQLVLVLEPLARACKCLESSKATASNVYLFWLAVLATYEQFFLDNNDIDGLQLPEDVVDQIRRIVNACWKELTTGPGKSVYLSTFFLDR
ncbi:ribonuclease H-like domain-containing protein [Gautieria morchelliformis]|nr:ribonuclease H-like domain-containing protein [Gautieria morchelliformis]